MIQVYIREYGKPRTANPGNAYNLQELSNIYVEYDNSSLTPSSTDSNIHFLCINGAGNIDETSPYDCSASGSTNGVLIVWDDDTERENYTYDLRSTGTLPSSNIIFTPYLNTIKANIILPKVYPLPDPKDRLKLWKK